jgi:hypothetical protein
VVLAPRWSGSVSFARQPAAVPRTNQESDLDTRASLLAEPPVAAPPPEQRAARRGRRTAWLAAALALATLVLALGPRLANLDLYVTADEDEWVQRSAAFRQAVERRRWPDTFQSHHPGVTTMWLGSLGMGASGERLIRNAPDPKTRAAGYLQVLASARRALVVAHALACALLVLLTWRLLGPAAALFSGLLLALDPFLVAHGQVLHLDGLLADLMAIALLATLVRWFATGHWLFLLLAGLATGLAWVTKVPSAFLLAAIPGLALAAHALGCPAAASRLHVGRDLLVWAGLAALVALLAWPALLVNPPGTLQLMLREALQEATQPHAAGNFFFGQIVSDPGPLFYPTVLAMRATPATLIGLLGLALLPRRGPLFGRALALAALTGGFILLVTLGSKKLDRYLLPALPLVTVLAGLGLACLAVRLRRRRPVWLVLPALLVATQALALLSVLPYPLAYYNPLFGGGPVASRVLLIGWGEGLDRAADYVNAQPDGATARIAVSSGPIHVQALFRGTVVAVDTATGPSYFVDYVSGRQRGLGVDLVRGRQPEFRAWINGIEYLRVYRLTPNGSPASAGAG